MTSIPPIPVARGKIDLALIPSMCNRHGLIAGSTGTGKTVTLRVLTEGFSSAGIPVFLADIKGDLSGIARPGGNNPRIEKRVEELHLDSFSYAGLPVAFWDIFGVSGIPMRATISSLGPLLLSRILNLNDTQAGNLSAVFRIADDQKLLLIDIKDLRAMITYVADHTDEFKGEYGMMSRNSLATIQRSLLDLEEQGGDDLFGEPELEIGDLFAEEAGSGMVHILSASRLFQSPRLYSTFLLWLLSELYENLPEVGDRDKPVMVFFFDEAHLLFDKSQAVLKEKIIQIIRLIRSKGIGVFFVTQNPSDIPDDVLGQLGNRFLHALRATTPAEQKAVQAAAKSFRENPGLDTKKALIELGIGEVLMSLLDQNGVPSPVERAFVYPPKSNLAPLESGDIQAIIGNMTRYSRYRERMDRHSAYEALKSMKPEEIPEKKPEKRVPAGTTREAPVSKRKTRQPAAVAGDLAADVAIQIGRSVSRELVRGILGSLTKGGRR